MGPEVGDRKLEVGDWNLECGPVKQRAESMAHSVIVDELEVVEIREVPCRCSARKLKTKDCKPKAHGA